MARQLKQLTDNAHLREWAWAVGESQTDHQTRWNSMNELHREAGSEMVYHKINFSDFTGIVLAGRDITEIIPCQKTLATALGNAYIISPAAGKGSGMFASRDIPAAGVILVENPVIVCPAISSNGPQESFGLLFDGLHPDVRAKALSLHNSDPLRPYAEGIVRTNAFGLPLESLDSAGPTEGMTHRGIFLDLSRCNHRHERTSLILQNTLTILLLAVLPTVLTYGISRPARAV